VLRQSLTLDAHDAADFSGFFCCALQAVFDLGSQVFSVQNTTIVLLGSQGGDVVLEPLGLVSNGHASADLNHDVGHHDVVSLNFKVLVFEVLLPLDVLQVDDFLFDHGNQDSTGELLGELGHVGYESAEDLHESRDTSGIGGADNNLGLDHLGEEVLEVVSNQILVLVENLLQEAVEDVLVSGGLLSVGVFGRVFDN